MRTNEHQIHEAILIKIIICKRHTRGSTDGQQQQTASQATSQTFIEHI